MQKMTETGATDIVEELDRAIKRFDLLEHPFYKAWSAGELSLEVLGEYSKQYYAHVHAFPTYVSAVHSHCDDLATRQLLLDNLVEEEQGDDNHPELWLRFAEGLGVSREAVEGAERLPSTTASVEALRQVTGSRDWLAGVAALYAYESQVPEVSKTKREGLASFYGIDDPRTVSFFSVHEQADVLHRGQEQDILRSRVETKPQRDAVLAAGETAARALWSFLDGVYEHSCSVT